MTAAYRGIRFIIVINVFSIAMAETKSILENVLYGEKRSELEHNIRRVVFEELNSSVRNLFVLPYDTEAGKISVSFETPVCEVNVEEINENVDTRELVAEICGNPDTTFVFARGDILIEIYANFSDYGPWGGISYYVEIVTPAKSVDRIPEILRTAIRFLKSI